MNKTGRCTIKVYIAGALSSKENGGRTPSQVVVDYLRNVHDMCKVAGEVRKLGYIPFVPALDLLLGAVNGDWAEEDYRGMGMEFLEVCDAVLVSSMSWGVRKELERAAELCIPVYYSLEELQRGYPQTTSELFQILEWRVRPVWIKD